MIELSETPYIAQLTEHEATVQPAVEALFNRLDIHVVGTGYIDAITRLERAEVFLEEISQIR